jgi:GPH family glycoside/pentoside/hexuronide:cation symporter
METKKRSMTLLSGGLFNRHFMDSKATTQAVSTKEWVLGHLIGPLGLIFVVNTIAALVEKFFTQQVGAIYGESNIEMVKLMGGHYEIVMTTAKVLAIGVSLLNGWLIQHTQSRQGRLRPWHLIFGFVSISIGCLIFLFPGNDLGGTYWYYFFFLLICYHTVGSTYFYLFRDTICSLVTRDPKEKTHIQFIRKMSWTLLSGIVIGMVFNMVMLPMWLEKDINGYPILMITVSLLAIPLLLLEYFYTRERITEDVNLEHERQSDTRIPLREQMRALMTNKYFVILITIATVSGIVDNFKGGNVQFFYIKFLLGGVDNPLMYTLYQVVTGIPLGIGAFLIYPLAKKVGIKNLTVGGYALVLIGSLMGFLFPDQLVPAMVGGFMRNVGWLPNAYIFATLLCFAYDSVEYKSHIRLEGLMGIAIITTIQWLIYAPFAGGFESGILRMGFVDAQGVMPTPEVTQFMNVSFYLFDAALAAVVVILLPFVDVEKKLPKINEELLRRKKEAVIRK